MLQSRLKASIVSDLDDVLVSQRDGEVLHGLGGNDTITANHFKLKIFGDAGNDVITSGYDKSAIHGGDGNDTIYGATYGSQIIEGGRGADVIDLTLYTAPLALTTTLSFAGALSGVRVSLAGDGTGYGTKGDAGGDVYLGHFGRVLGSGSDDWITDTTPDSLEVG